MGAVSQYWCLVRIDGGGRRQVKPLDPAKTFLEEQFDELIQEDVPDATLQQKLLYRLKDEEAPPLERDLAELCLRCFISHQAEQICIRLEQQFGSRHSFSRQDLLPLVLDDDGRLRSQRRSSAQYHLIADEILGTFDPTKASLGTWAVRLIRSHRELNLFLQEQGVYLASDWAILNDTSLEQAQRVLSTFHSLVQVEVEQSGHLLRAYHLVYRQDRLKLRQLGALKGKEQCQTPTAEQLTRIAAYLRELTNLSVSPESILSKLRTLADQLRQYRISIRSGAPAAQSLDDPDTHLVAIATPTPQDEDQEEQHEFLQFYREQFMACLDQALAQVTGDRTAYLSRKSSQKANQFVHALHLFHCQGQAMGEIATKVGLKAQFEVSRLMKLKEFRANVRQKLLVLLSDRILHRAKVYTDSQQLHTLDQQIESALNEQIEEMLHQAETEAAVARQHPLKSVFARRLCRHLDLMSPALS